jgi:hypothetical protein
MNQHNGGTLESKALPVQLAAPLHFPNTRRKIALTCSMHHEAALLYICAAQQNVQSAECRLFNVQAEQHMTKRK